MSAAILNEEVLLRSDLHHNIMTLDMGIDKERCSSKSAVRERGWLLHFERRSSNGNAALRSRAVATGCIVSATNNSPA